MAKFSQNIISARFLEVLDELKSKQKVDNDADFCRRVGYLHQSFSKIRKGERDVTIDLISKLFTEFKGSPFYLLTGKGSKILQPYALSIVEEEAPSYGESTGGSTETLEELVKSKNEIISLLKQKIADLESENKGKGKDKKAQV